MLRYGTLSAQISAGNFVVLDMLAAWVVRDKTEHVRVDGLSAELRLELQHALHDTMKVAVLAAYDKPQNRMVCAWTTHLA